MGLFGVRVAKESASAHEKMFKILIALRLVAIASSAVVPILGLAVAEWFGDVTGWYGTQD